MNPLFIARKLVKSPLRPLLKRPPAPRENQRRQIFGAGGEFFTFEKRKEGRTKKERRKGEKSERKFVFVSTNSKRNLLILWQ